MPMIAMRDQQRLFVRTLGQGQPVLMLPGLGMSSYQWLPFVWPFRRRYRFLMPDFRGHGRSAHATLNQADVFQNHADDVEDVIRHFGLDDYLLVGISLGCTTAMHLERDDRLGNVRAYLHIDQSPCVVNQPDWPYGLAGARQEALFAVMQAIDAELACWPDQAYFYQLPRQVRRGLAEQITRAFALLGVGAARRAVMRQALTMPAWLGRRLPLQRCADIRAYMQAYAGGGHDYRPTLGKAGAPVTLMAGMRSPLYHSDGQRLVAERAAQGQVIEFHRSGHVPLMDEPVKFMRHFRGFLEGGRAGG
ncbi:MAG: alpha/beta hydrolase [Alcanivoracaceae bacterium]|nr:alpha/beta hydrolase [Alcanivoracaceae bacterium]